MNKLKIVTALILFFLATISKGEPIYKWVDEHGITHYSAATPKDKKTLQLKSQPAAPATQGKNEQPTLKDPQAKGSLKPAPQETADNQQKTDHEKRCAIAKQRLSILQQQSRQFRANSKGEKESVDDDERNEDTQKMKEEIENNC
jgi:hypothetical protein